MGQYHYICNLDTKEYLDPSEFGDGLKLLEFGCSGSGTMTALAVLLAEQNGRGGGDLRTDDSPIPGLWAGARITVMGDYFDKETDPVARSVDTTPWDVDTDWTNISTQVKEALRADGYLNEALRPTTAEYLEEARKLHAPHSLSSPE